MTCFPCAQVVNLLDSLWLLLRWAPTAGTRTSPHSTDPEQSEGPSTAQLFNQLTPELQRAPASFAS